MQFRSSSYFSLIKLAVFVIVWTVLIFAAGYYYSQRQFKEAELLFERMSYRYGLPHEDLDWYGRFSALQSWIEVADKTHEQMKQHLYDNDQAIKELEEQLYFYRSVMVPEEKGSDLSVFSVSLKQFADSRTYPIEVVLRNHNVKKNKVVQGRVKVSVEGTVKSLGEKLVREDLLGGELEFSLKYFQRLQGLLQVPDDFVPYRLGVAVSTDKNKSFENTYDWEGLLKQNR